MHPAEIQMHLKKREITQKMIAAELGVSEFHVSEVVHKKRNSDRVMQAVSKAIGKNPHEVFPEYYFRKIKRVKAG